MSFVFRAQRSVLQATFCNLGVYTFADGELTPYCALPAGGDCAYPAAVQVGDEMFVSYYSSHEGSTNVYLARVPLRK